MPQISVIVPVYKVEPYLDRCVKSVLNQTFSDFELILVDDGSPDECPRLCDEWATKDNRIRVIHKENGGLSDARNVGFEASTGEWITFVDSDDYIHPQTLEALYQAVTEHNVNVSICGFAKTQGEPLNAVDFTSHLWLPEVFFRERNVNATVAWGKLYHRSVVLPYPKGKLHEDDFVTYQILFSQAHVGVVEAPLYAYFQCATSIMHQPWAFRRMDELSAYVQQIDYFKASYPELRRWRIRGIMKCILSQLDLITNQNQQNPQGEKALKKWGRKVLRIYWQDHVFRGDTDLWIYKRFYPHLTQFYIYATAIFRKFLYKKSGR